MFASIDISIPLEESSRQFTPSGTYLLDREGGESIQFRVLVAQGDGLNQACGLDTATTWSGMPLDLTGYPGAVAVVALLCRYDEVLAVTSKRVHFTDFRPSQPETK